MVKNISTIQVVEKYYFREVYFYIHTLLQPIKTVVLTQSKYNIIRTRKSKYIYGLLISVILYVTIHKVIITQPFLLLNIKLNIACFPIWSNMSVSTGYLYYLYTVDTTNFKTLYLFYNDYIKRRLLAINTQRCLKKLSLETIRPYKNFINNIYCYKHVSIPFCSYKKSILGQIQVHGRKCLAKMD